jgi:hypothetical protein
MSRPTYDSEGNILNHNDPKVAELQQRIGELEQANAELSAEVARLERLCLEKQAEIDQANDGKLRYDH